AYELQAWTLNGLGRFDEAIAKTKKAVELDPLNPFFQMSLSFYQYWESRYHDAIAQARKTLAMDPNSAISHVLLGLSFLKKGDTAGCVVSRIPRLRLWLVRRSSESRASVARTRTTGETVIRQSNGVRDHLSLTWSKRKMFGLAGKILRAAGQRLLVS